MDGVVTCMEDSRHGLEDGDFVTFTEVQGMQDLNACTPRKITVLGPYTFKIGDTSAFHDYKTGGYFNQVKMPKTVDFKSYQESFCNPECLVSDFAKFERPLQLHLCFQALSVFEFRTKRLPIPRNEADSLAFLAIVKELSPAMSSPPDLTEEIIKQFSYQARGDLPPMNAVLGGMVAQEILKASSGKFMPIQQYFYFDSLESLPTSSPITEDGCKPSGSRYDAQVAVFGKEFQDKIGKLSKFTISKRSSIPCRCWSHWM